MYYLLLIIFYPISWLPFRLLYVLSDGLFFLLYNVFKYRRSVVKNNLINSFPNKSLEEIESIEKKFYNNLCDAIFENIKLLSISKKELNKRVSCNWEVVHEIHKTGRVAQAHLCHMFSWEMSTVACGWNQPYQFVGLYNKVSNNAFNRLMNAIRSRSGVIMLDMNLMLTEMGKFQQQNTLWGFIADQNPSEPRRGHWQDFLNQKTVFYKGGELVARRYNNIVIFGKINKVKRGYYKVALEKYYDQGGSTKDGEITTAYVNFLEKAIHEQPENWVWSHRRWKHKWEGK